MKKILLFLLIVLGSGVIAQEKGSGDSCRHSRYHISFSPILGFNTDIGMQIGAMANIYDHGKDGFRYPDYNYTVYLEYSESTKGSGVKQFFFDSKHLLPGGLRLTADISYLTEKRFDFYGFNGYQSVFHKEYEDEDSPDYQSRLFYHLNRKLFRSFVDIQGQFANPHIRWLAGGGYYHYLISSLEIEKMNRGKKPENQLPDVEVLYDKYVNWGLFADNEKDGGNIPFLKAGIIYDTRDEEASPKNGIWAEAILLSSPVSGDYNFTKLALTFRNYLNLYHKKVILASRISYQSTITGHTPFFFQPVMINSFSQATSFDAVGGAKSVRGIRRSRAIGDAIIYGTIELRYEFWETKFLNQEFIFGLSPFLDAGLVTQFIDVQLKKVPEGERDIYFNDIQKDRWHTGYGMSIRFLWNRNFILGFDYGIAHNQQDGKSAGYVSMGYMF
jgi:hypothetical protein